MDNYFTKKEQIIILSFVLIVVGFIGFKLGTSNNFDRGERSEFEDTLVDFEEDKDKEVIEDESFFEDSVIMIHISGQVHVPGIIQLNSGERLIDAIELAGGLKKDADLDKINLARKLSDEDKIYIPAIGEDIEIESYMEISSDEDTSTKINVNVCTKEELTSLPGIGDAIADRIIEYRESTPFSSVEDLMNVSGIGEKKFEDMKDLIIIK